MSPATRRRVRLQKLIAAGKREVRKHSPEDNRALSYNLERPRLPRDVTDLAAAIVEAQLGYWKSWHSSGYGYSVLVLTAPEEVDV